MQRKSVQEKGKKAPTRKSLRMWGIFSPVPGDNICRGFFRLFLWLLAAGKELPSSI